MAPLKQDTQPNKAFGVKTELQALLQLALPILIAQIAFTAMGFVDTIMSGRYSEVDLAAIAMGTSITLPIIFFGQALLFSITAKAAPLWGQRRFQEAGDIFKHGCVLAICSSMPLIALLLWLSQNLDIFGMEAELADIAKHYQYFIAAALPITGLYQAARSFIEATGQTKPIMLVNITGLVANIPLNYLFIYGIDSPWLSLSPMGSVGCGLATLLCFTLMLVGLLSFIRINHRCKRAFVTTKQKQRADKRAKQNQAYVLRPSVQGSLELLKLGFPIACTLTAEVSLFTAIALLIAPLGTVVIASHQVALSLSSQIYMIPYSQSAALSIRIGHLIGIGHKAHTAFTVKLGLAVSILLSILTATIVLISSEPIAKLFTDSEAIVAIAVGLLTLAAFYQIPDAIQVVSNGILRAFEQVRKPFFLSLIAYWLIALPLGYYLCYQPLQPLLALITASNTTDTLNETYPFIQSPLGIKGFWIALIVGLSINACFLSILLYQQVKHYLNKSR